MGGNIMEREPLRRSAYHRDLQGDCQDYMQVKNLLETLWGGERKVGEEEMKLPAVKTMSQRWLIISGLGVDVINDPFYSCRSSQRETWCSISSNWESLFARLSKLRDDGTAKTFWRQRCEVFDRRVPQKVEKVSRGNLREGGRLQVVCMLGGGVSVKLAFPPEQPLLSLTFWGPKVPADGSLYLSGCTLSLRFSVSITFAAQGR